MNKPSLLNLLIIICDSINSFFSKSFESSKGSIIILYPEVVEPTSIPIIALIS